MRQRGRVFLADCEGCRDHKARVFFTTKPAWGSQRPAPSIQKDPVPSIAAAAMGFVESVRAQTHANSSKTLIATKILEPLIPIFKKMDQELLEPASYGGVRAFSSDHYVESMKDGSCACAIPFSWIGLVPCSENCLLGFWVCL